MAPLSGVVPRSFSQVPDVGLQGESPSYSNLARIALPAASCTRPARVSRALAL